MSFRSRSRNVQPVIQRRSLSGSRLPSTISTYTNNRPLSSAYPNSVSYTSSNYISPYTSSRDSIYGSTSTRNSLYSSSGSHTPRRDSYSGSTIYKNPYTSDRYISPYTSYDNGITTAGLSIKSSSYSTANSYGTANSYSSKGSYTPLSSVYMNKPLSRHSSNLKSASNSSLNTFSLAQANATIDKAKKLGRSQSYRDPASEHKSRTLRRNSSLKSERSLSVSSEKSEGYEVRIIWGEILVNINKIGY